jgi:regulator of RNase E activity RraA
MRDASTVLRLGHLMYRGRFMRTGKDRVEVDTLVPIAVGDVRVRRGDIVTGGGGVVVVPHHDQRRSTA